MRKIYKYICLAAAAILSLPSCMVHEFPEGERNVDIAITLQFDKAMTDYKTVTKVDPSDLQGLQVRYTLKAFEYSGDAYDKKAKYTATFYREDLSSMDNTLHFILPAGRYRIICWADYSVPGSDTFWNPADFTAVTISDVYYGDSDWRDAFYGEVNVDVSDFRASAMSYLAVMPMNRPLAKYRLVATDKDDFVTRSLGKGAEDTKGDDTKAGFDFTTFTSRVDYLNFFPSAFNTFNGRNVDSRTGLFFDGNLREIDNGEVEMAIDYVLAVETETKVTLNLTLFDAAGTDLGTVRSITIPIVRGGITTVEGKFLTTGSVSGIFVDPSFDEDDFNITIR